MCRWRKRRCNGREPLLWILLKLKQAKGCRGNRAINFSTIYQRFFAQLSSLKTFHARLKSRSIPVEPDRLGRWQQGPLDLRMPAWKKFNSPIGCALTHVPSSPSYTFVSLHVSFQLHCTSLRSTRNLLHSLHPSAQGPDNLLTPAGGTSNNRCSLSAILGRVAGKQEGVADLMWYEGDRGGC